MNLTLSWSLVDSPVFKVECDDILFLKENEDRAGKGFCRSGLKCVSDFSMSRICHGTKKNSIVCVWGGRESVFWTGEEGNKGSFLGFLSKILDEI